MPKFNIYGIATISKHLGTVEAATKEEAVDKAWDELSDKTHISICHRCSHEMGDTPEISSLEAEEAE